MKLSKSFCILSLLLKVIYSSADDDAHPLSSTNGKAALALMGGGFKSVSVFSGIIAGLLSRSSMMDEQLQQNIAMEEPSLVNTGLLNNIDMISSVSGGGWFILQLIYSDHFREIIENVSGAASVDDAKNIFNDGWSFPQKSAWNDKSFSGTSGINMWSDYNRELLKVGGIDEEMTLGDAPQEWADGKVLISNHAIVLRGESDGEWEDIWARRIATWRSRLLYKIENMKDVGQGQFLPAAFSVTLGAGKHHPSPVNYTFPLKVANESPETVMKYQGRKGIATRINGELHVNKLQKKSTFGDLPVYAAADATSALAGLESEATGNAIRNVVWASYSSLQGTSNQSYKRANEFVRGIFSKNEIDQNDVETAANMGLHELTDAHHTDPTGIALAIAAGATEVFSLIHSKIEMFGRLSYPHFMRFFVGGPGSDRKNADCRCRIFEEDAADVERQVTDNWVKLHNPSKNFVEDIRMGTLTVTTISNDLYGITGGISVKLHVIFVAATVAIAEQGFFFNMDAYEAHGSAVAEVREIMKSRRNDIQVTSFLNALKRFP